MVDTINNSLIERIAQKGYEMEYHIGNFTWEEELEPCKDLWRRIAKMAIEEALHG